MADSRDSITTTIDTYIATYSATDREGWRAIPDSIELRLGELRIVIGQEAAFTLESRPNLGGETYRFDVIDHMSFDAEGKITSYRAFYDVATMRPARD